MSCSGVNGSGHMQVCTSLQTDNHASTLPLSFYRPDALPNQQCQSTEGSEGKSLMNKQWNIFWN